MLVATDGATKLAILLFAPVSVTAGPPVCTQATLVAEPPETAPVSVTVLPEVVWPEDPATTVRGIVGPLEQADSNAPPNTAAVAAERPPINACRRE